MNLVFSSSSLDVWPMDIMYLAISSQDMCFRM